MKFAVTCSKGFDKLKTYKPILEKYSLEINPIIDASGEEESELLYITIETLQELDSLRNNTSGRLVILNSYYDEFYNEHIERAIEIYDGYRE